MQPDNLSSETDARSYCADLVGEEAVSRLTEFAEMLAEENRTQNLVSRSSLDRIWQRHLADSVQLLEFVPRETGIWLDLGAGAGFPGIVIAFCHPERRIKLVDSRRKRIDWLQRVVAHFGLANCEVAGTRVEDLPSFAAGVISARAFAPLGRLLQLSGRFSTKDTMWVLPKGRSAAKELEQQSSSVRAMFHVEHSRTDTQAGILVGQGEPELA